MTLRPPRVSTRRPAGGVSPRASTLSFPRPQRLSLLKLSPSCRARWDRRSSHHGRRSKKRSAEHNSNLHCTFQTRYKEAGRKEANSSLYSLLPETLETAHAKEASELLSEVNIKPQRWSDRVQSLLRGGGRRRCVLLVWPRPFRRRTGSIHWWENRTGSPIVSLYRSNECVINLQVKYKEEGKKEMSINLYSLLPATIDTQHAKELSDLQSEVWPTLYILYTNQ